MISSIKVGDLTIRGISLGGIYTSLQVPEIHSVFDVGIAPRSFAGSRRLFISHGHADHLGSLPALLGIRGLLGSRSQIKAYMPAEIVEPVKDMLAAAGRMQRYDMSVDAIGMNPGDELPLDSNLVVRAFRTFHPVPSLGYMFIRRIDKLRPEFRGLPGKEIGERRKAGEDLFDQIERIEFAYCTDTLVGVLDKNPQLYQARVLTIECTFLDERKSLETAQAGCHIHLDELLERAHLFENEHVVFMHFSQIYRPSEIESLLDRRCPPEFRKKIVPLLPRGRHWPG